MLRCLFLCGCCVTYGMYDVLKLVAEVAMS